MKGYETYAVLKGGEKVIQFSDNSDIVTDKEASAVEGWGPCLVFQQRYQVCSRS
jgi:hypothetical protein